MTFGYPAVFRKEKDGTFTGFFPDLEGVEVYGKTIDDCTREARSALYDYLTVEFEEDDPQLPYISDISDIPLEKDECVKQISVHYRFHVGWDE